MSMTDQRVQSPPTDRNYERQPPPGGAGPPWLALLQAAGHAGGVCMAG